jgi:hypothetical protein
MERTWSEEREDEILSGRVEWEKVRQRNKEGKGDFTWLGTS